MKEEEEANEALAEGRRKLPMEGFGRDTNIFADKVKAAKVEAAKERISGGLGNPCRRRLQLGIQGCGAWGYGTSDSFSVSMSRSANKESGHTHAVHVFLGDGNAQDVFALRVAQDPVFGTPVFTTLGGF